MGYKLSIDQTDQKILTAFFELGYKYQGTFHEITLTEIAEQANLTRPTVYGRFGKKSDILHFLHNYLKQEVRATIEKSIHADDIWKYLSENVIPKIYDLRNYLKPLYCTEIDPVWLHYLEEDYQRLLEARISDKFHRTLAIKTILDLVEHWLNHDFPESVETFSNKFYHTMIKKYPIQS